jgi:hypothetical protein
MPRPDRAHRRACPGPTTPHGRLRLGWDRRRERSHCREVPPTPADDGEPPGQGPEIRPSRFRLCRIERPQHSHRRQVPPARADGKPGGTATRTRLSRLTLRRSRAPRAQPPPTSSDNSGRRQARRHSPKTSTRSPQATSKSSPHSAATADKFRQLRPTTASPAERPRDLDSLASGSVRIEPPQRSHRREVSANSGRRRAPGQGPEIPTQSVQALPDRATRAQPPPRSSGSSGR